MTFLNSRVPHFVVFLENLILLTNLDFISCAFCTIIHNLDFKKEKKIRHFWNLFKLLFSYICIRLLNLYLEPEEFNSIESFCVKLRIMVVLMKLFRVFKPNPVYTLFTSRGSCILKHPVNLCIFVYTMHSCTPCNWFQ